MNSFQSKFSNKKANSSSSKGPKTSSGTSGCGCGSKRSDGVEEIDVIEVDEE